MVKHFFTLVLLFTAGLLSGQGWERVYGGGGTDAAYSITRAHDGGYVLAGYYGGLTRLYLIKTDADGNQQWEKTVLGSPRLIARAITATRDTGYLVTGYVGNTSQGSRDLYLLKVNGSGKTLWSKNIGSPQQGEEGFSIAELADGNIVVAGYATSAADPEGDVLVVKTDPRGNVLWQKTFGKTGYQESANSLAIASNGDVVIVGEIKEDKPLDDREVSAIRIDAASGDLIWQQIYDLSNALGTEIGDEVARSITATNDGGFILAGDAAENPNSGGLLFKIDGAGSPIPLWSKTIPSTVFNGVTKGNAGRYFATGQKDISAAQIDLVVVSFDNSGNIFWSTSVGKGGPDFGNSIVATPDGGAVATGSSQRSIVDLEERFYLVKTDAQGKVLTSYLKGNVYRDLDKNCDFGGTEKGLEDWIVRVERQKDKDVVYLATDKAGNFRWAVDTGLHKIEVVMPHRYWQSCTPSFAVSVKNFYDTVSFRLPVQAAFDCPRNEVSIATPLLRRCVDNTYTIRYCNSGSVPSQDTRIRVSLDPGMSFVNSSIPGAAKDGNTYEFAVGTLDNGICGSFTLTAKLNCEAELKGSTHCVTARIFPDSFCNASAAWDGSIVAAAARCENDSVKFALRNIGKGNMKKDLGFVVTEDIIMITTPNDPQYQFRLASGEEKTYWQNPATGQTYRIIAEQSEGYPGESYPTAAVEGCKSKNGGDVSLGFYTMFPEDDADAFVDTDCQESAEADDNPSYSKRGHPKGYDVLRYVNPETDLTYLIQFSNTGSSAVEQVVIRDTLPAQLDPSTVFPGTASHPYDFQVYGQGIVQFTLSNLNLPPNSSAGEGFVQFRVSQKPNLPCGTPILNRAAVYFDYNAPVVTGQVRHTSCPFDDYVTVSTDNISWKGAEVNVSPNPFSEVARFEVKGVEAQTFSLELYDIQGRLISNPFFNQSTFQLFRPDIPAGIILYRLTADGKPVATGKIMAY